MGCGRRVGGYHNAMIDKNNNVDLAYICDVMKKQRERVAMDLQGKVSGEARMINDIRDVFDDTKMDAIFNATPDHWHAQGTWMAMEAGKHVYIEKPCSIIRKKVSCWSHFKRNTEKSFRWEINNDPPKNRLK